MHRQFAQSKRWSADQVKVLRPTRHTLCNFGDVLPSQSRGLVVKNREVVGAVTDGDNGVGYSRAEQVSRIFR